MEATDTNSNIDFAIPMVPPGKVPYYLSEAFGDLYEEDGLLCMGQGLQWLSLLAVLCRFYSGGNDTNDNVTYKPPPLPKPLQPQQQPLVLILGLKDETERQALLALLQSWGTPVHLLPTMIASTTSNYNTTEPSTTTTSSSALAATTANSTISRATVYQRGGVVAVTSRILIVDLLTGMVQTNCIAGMIVVHAHTVTDQSTEAFILRIYKSQKQLQFAQQAHDAKPKPVDIAVEQDDDDDDVMVQDGFIKAITDYPDGLLAGFAQVDKILKALHVRKLYLYPRFHDSIRNELEPDGNNNNNNMSSTSSNTIQVTELQPKLSNRQREIQSALAVLVVQCLRQLKQQTAHLVSWTATTTTASTSGHKNYDDGSLLLSVENCVVTEQFDRAVSRQLDPQWHRLSPSVKQLVQDLRTLRTLFHALLQYDCIAFWKLLTSLRTMSAASRYPSLWLLETATDTLFAKAKERVYTIHRPTPTEQIPQPVAELVTVLEENPKWRLLRTVLQEIRQEEDRGDRAASSNGSVINILVMVQDDKTLDSLKSYLVDDTASGSSKTLQLRWLRFLEQCNDRSRSRTEMGAGNLSEESRLLIEAEGRARRILFGEKNEGRNGGKRKQPKGTQHQKQRSSTNQVPGYLRKRRKIAVEKGRGAIDSDDLERQAVLEEAVEATMHDLDGPCDGSEDMDDSTANDAEEMFHVYFPENELRVVLRSYSSIVGDQGHMLLQDIQPQYVVLFDSNVAFIRAVEIYSALATKVTISRNPFGRSIRVFFLMFEASAEEKNFKKALEREQNAFERLIHHKQTMPPPFLQSLETQEMQQALQQGSGVAGTYMNGSLPLSMDTRRGKGRSNNSKDRRDIVVDVREFRSVLPSILHQGGMRLAPATLIVGDFVLSNVHCVERKSISDLYGSFASGRLYTQAEAMSKYYKCPCLLIEFDLNKSFCLQNSNELGVEIRTDSICSRMALLAMHFPKLRILWCRSPHETLKVFRELKVNHDEVDVDRAVEIGRNESEELLLHPDVPDGDDDEINEAARAMLLRLPGVNVHSARRIMQECDSLAELCELSREDLRRIAGPITGQKLFTFFRQKMGST